MNEDWLNKNYLFKRYLQINIWFFFEFHQIFDLIRWTNERRKINYHRLMIIIIINRCWWASNKMIFEFYLKNLFFFFFVVTLLKFMLLLCFACYSWKTDFNLINSTTTLHHYDLKSHPEVCENMVLAFRVIIPKNFLKKIDDWCIQATQKR